MGDVDDEFWVRPFQVMEWSNEAALALIEEYRKQPALWDCRHASYSSKSQKHEGWDAIAAAMQLDVQEVKQKMNSLLGSFRREKSRMRKCNANGGDYCPKWFAFEKMQFLMRYDTPGIKLEEEDETLLEELCYPLQETLESSQNDKRTSSASHKRQKKLLRPLTDPLLEGFTFSTSPDECSAFGQYLACKLRTYESRTRAFAEHAINNVLFEADMGKYEDVRYPLTPLQPQWAEASENDSGSSSNPQGTSFQ